jgi:hypothetical protein
MANVDALAADIELRKAEECSAQAEELTVIAGRLREDARSHMREADELRGATRRHSNGRNRRRADAADFSARRRTPAAARR